MLTAATTSTTSINLVWWQALAAAGTVAFVALAAGIIVIFGRRTFVGSASQRSPAGAVGVLPAGAGTFLPAGTAAILPGGRRHFPFFRRPRPQVILLPAGTAVLPPAGTAVGPPSGPGPAGPAGPAADPPSGPGPAAPSGPAADHPPGPGPAAPSGPAPAAPVTAAVPGPVTAAVPGPVTAAPSGPVTAAPSGPVTAAVPGSAAAHPAGQGAADPPGPAAAHPAGQGHTAVPAAAAAAPGPAAAPPDQSTSQPDGDFIRSWIAVVLVIGLVFFCAFAFSLNDQSLQSTLIGGLIASVGSAIAFYFSSKASDKARQDVANAANIATDLVPSLIGRNKKDASQILSQTSFSLIEDPSKPSKSDTAVINAQNPLPNTTAPRGSAVVVTFPDT